jgi:hypothetical protein
VEAINVVILYVMEGKIPLVEQIHKKWITEVILELTRIEKRSEIQDEGGVR